MAVDWLGTWYGTQKNGTYKYKYPATSKAYFFEYHGLSAPPADLGTIDDVCFDVIPGRYVVYIYCTLKELQYFKENIRVAVDCAGTGLTPSPSCQEGKNAVPCLSIIHSQY